MGKGYYTLKGIENGYKKFLYHDHIYLAMIYYWLTAITAYVPT